MAVPPVGTNTPLRVSDDVKAAEHVAEKKSSDTGAKKEVVEKPSVYGFSICDNQISFHLHPHPDLTTFTDYITIEPSPGPVSMNYIKASPYNNNGARCNLTADFKPNVDYRVTIGKGLPFLNGSRLERTIVSPVLRAGNLTPRFAFAEVGRYLPPGGSDAVVVETVNVTNLYCSIARIAPQNIIQLLARENNCYAWYFRSSIDEEETKELADGVKTFTLSAGTDLNLKNRVCIPVRLPDAAVSNGVFLVGVKKMPTERALYRLVCRSDIGLSVRRAGDTVAVWATSLTKGSPLAGLKITIYGNNNIPLASGFTGADGQFCTRKHLTERSVFAVIAEKKDASDLTFLAVTRPLDEPLSGPERRPFLASGACEAYGWTERGIYRHNEPILTHFLLRDADGRAPKPFPVELRLINPTCDTYMRKTVMPDASGIISTTAFSVPDGQMSGPWHITASVPGLNESEFGSTSFRVESFVPPQIRVKVSVPDGQTLTNLSFLVSAEHLFGGPARRLKVDGAVLFTDEPFQPKGWDRFRFGDERKGVRSALTSVDSSALDENGKVSLCYTNGPTTSLALPKAALKAYVQGSVHEAGGRSVSGRASTIIHVYPFYIGADLPERVNAVPGGRKCRIVLLRPDGSVCTNAPRLLQAHFERKETVFSLKYKNGSMEWSGDTIRYPACPTQEIPVAADGSATVTIPASETGDFALSIIDPSSDVSFSASYWVAAADDSTVRTPLSTPTHVSLAADRKVYSPGDRPRLTVKAPFAGTAWISVLRDRILSTHVMTLTNVTSEICLDPIDAKWAPGVDVSVSVVQAVKADAKHLANRAYGILTLPVERPGAVLKTAVEAKARCNPMGGSDLNARISAPDAGPDARAVVTVVDEGINILTDQPVPDPAAWFAETRCADHPLCDIFNALLPIVDGTLKRSGVKTGGDTDSGLLRRMSPVSSRRFKPLSLWKTDVPLTAGRAEVDFRLPEFVGEVRVTAVVYNDRATGTAAAQVKVVPALVTQPDAPRFAAPGDVFDATLTLSNRSGTNGIVQCRVTASGSTILATPFESSFMLTAGASTTLLVRVTADAAPGSGKITFLSKGLGEQHLSDIDLPIRPAVAWEQTSRAVCLKPGAVETFPAGPSAVPAATRRAFTRAAGPWTGLTAALDYLAEYPYGCLEQTTSCAFPLLFAGGVLNTLDVPGENRNEIGTNRITYAIRRVSSMVRENDFVMWPDVNTPPWDRSVSLWAAWFLTEADRAGFTVPAGPFSQVKTFLRRWAMSTNETVSVTACHVLAVAQMPDTGRQLHWYDLREHLTGELRCRLALAFAASGDPVRARELLSVETPLDTSSSRALAILAYLSLDPENPRLPGLVLKLLGNRDPVCGHWLTTGENALALMALSSWYRTQPAETGHPELALWHQGRERLFGDGKRLIVTGPGDITVTNRGTGAAWFSMTRLSLPPPERVTPLANGITMTRHCFLNDHETDLGNIKRGDLLTVRLTLSNHVARVISDLVIEELLPACFDGGPLFESTSDSRDSKNALQKYELRRDYLDDKVLIFLKPLRLAAGEKISFSYSAHAVSSGTFTCPGVSIEAMYDPETCARTVPKQITVAP